MRYLVISLVFVTCCDVGAADAQPGHQEADLVAKVNLLRTDFRAGAVIVREAIVEERVKGKREDLWCTYADVNSSSQPVVFSPALAAAARLLLDRNVSMPTGTEFDAGPLALKSGYGAAGKPMTALRALQVSDLPTAFAAACLELNHHIRPSDGYEWDDYTGLILCRPEWREVGVAAISNGGKVSIVIVLGQGSGVRLLGGISYADANRNGQYDPGEGQPGVSVAYGSTSMVTGPGGIWWLSGAAGEEQVLSFSVGEAKASRKITKESNQFSCDWRIPVISEMKRVDKLIADAEAVPRGAVRAADGPLLALLAGTRRTALDDGREERVEKLVEPVKEAYLEACHSVCAAIGDSPEATDAAIKSLRGRYAGMPAAWFTEATHLATLKRQVDKTMIPKAKTPQPMAVVAQIDRVMGTAQEPTFWSCMASWRSALVAKAKQEDATKGMMKPKK